MVALGSKVPIPQEPPPLFAQFMMALAPHVQWLAHRLACSEQLPLRCLHLVVSHLVSRRKIGGCDWRWRY